MKGTALILGASGRFGRNMAQAFEAADWQVRLFRRGTDDLAQAAQGADVIAYGWNPAYTDWVRQVPGQVAQVIVAAQSSGATVILPGNVYVFGPDAPAEWSETTPHGATHPLGRVRREMEAAFRASGVRTILLRAGDYLDTGPTGNWFDQVLIKRLDKGKLIYPGQADAAHAWAYLPDMACAAVALAEIRDGLARFEDVPFPGYTLTGQDLAQALSRVTGRPVRLSRMAWLPIRLARPFWPMAGHFLEMRYLWNKPHRLDSTRLHALLPGFRDTPLEVALVSAIQHKINPDQPVPGQNLPLDQSS